MLRKSHKVKPIKRSSKKTPKKSSKKTIKYKFMTKSNSPPSQVKVLSDKIKKGKPFSKVEIDKITEMFKKFGKQIKNKEIHNAFEKVLHFLGTIEKDRPLTPDEKSKMEMIQQKIYEEMVKKRKIGLQSHFTPHRRGRSRSRADDTPPVAPVAAESCPVCWEDYDDSTHKAVTLCEKTNSSGEKIIHKVCEICVKNMTDDRGEIDCPLCRQRSQSPFARARGSAPASARGRGPPPAAQRHTANAEPEMLVQIMTMVSALISAWALYMIFWKIPPESLDLFGFCKTVAASTISLLIFLLLASSSR